MNQFLRPDIIWVLIPVTAIVVGGVVTIIRQVHRHRERQALIDQGFHPDFPPDEDTDTPDQLKKTVGYRRNAG